MDIGKKKYPFTVMGITKQFTAFCKLKLKKKKIMGTGAEMNTNNNNNQNNVNNLPKGKYTLVGIDVDTTGRRLIDEIVQLSAYTPKTQYAQYIMPYMNLNPAARQRHQIRVITIGFYRMLKCMQTYKVVKSKSEIAALKDFLDWLESFKKSDPESNGVILIYHEERKFTPYMMLEAFKKYGLLDRFLMTVKSFTNGYELAKAQCCTHYTTKQFSLRQLSKILLNKNEVNDTSSDKDNNSNKKKYSDIQQIEYFEGNASVRAKLAFEIAQHLSIHTLKDDDDDDGDDNDENNKNNGNDISTTTNLTNNKNLDKYDIENKMLNLVYEHAPPTSKELDELEIQNKNLERQNSFRPVFIQYFKTTLYHRVRAVKFRIILAENGLDFETLKAIWTEKRKEGLTEVIQALQELKSDEKDELIDLLDAHYDPSKQPLKPVMKKPRRRPRRSKNRNKENIKSRESTANNQGAGDERSQLPDSSTRTPIKKAPRNRSKNNINSSQGSTTAIASNL